MTPATAVALAVLGAALGAVGGSAALRDLYRRCSGRVMAVALRILGDRGEAEDVVQETFLALWRRADEHDPRRASLEAWAIVLARSRAIDRLRSRASAARAAEAQAREPVREGPRLDPVEARQDQERVARAIAGLPAQLRRTLELALWEGLSHGQIAARTGEPLGTIKSRLRSAMDRLHAELVSREEAP